MGRVGSALDNTAAEETFNSTLEWELLLRKHFATKAQARSEVAGLIDRYNHRRRHSSCETQPPSSTNRFSPTEPPRTEQHENQSLTATSISSEPIQQHTGREP